MLPVKFSDFLQRKIRRGLLIEINPYQILVAGISRLDASPAVLDCAAEFDREDEAGLRQWLGENFDQKKGWLPAIGSFSTPDLLLQRESLLPRKLVEPSYLAALVREQFKIENPEQWKLQTLSPMEGLALPPEGTSRPALICGVSHHDVHQTQQRLLDFRLLPYRLEMSILPLLGTLTGYRTSRNDKRAVVVIVIEREHTVAYIIGKEGIHCPALVRHGFSSIAQAAGKEFGLTEAAAISDRLHQADEDLLLRASKLVRAIGRDIKPVVDSYEMTTGQPVGEIYCAYLPPKLAWITEPLAQVVGRSPLIVDSTAWMQTINLQARDIPMAFGAHWLGVLSLLADGSKLSTSTAYDDAPQDPWRVDCRLSAQLPSEEIVRRRFLTNAIAVAVAAGLLMISVWQLYLSTTLQTDISYWQQQITERTKDFGDLNKNVRQMNQQTAQLDNAYALMGTPYSVAALIPHFGRTRLAKMRIESIAGTPGGVFLRGSLQEPSEQAARTLQRYVNGLRNDHFIGPLFASIILTSLERQAQTDTLTFEVTCKLPGSQP